MNALKFIDMQGFMYGVTLLLVICISLHKFLEDTPILSAAEM